MCNGRKKLQKFEYLENEKSIFDEIKIMFMIFEGLSFHNNKKLRAQTNFK